MMEGYWAKGNEYWPDGDFPYWSCHPVVLLQGEAAGASSTPDVTLLLSRVVRDVTEFMLYTNRETALDAFIERVRVFDTETELGS